MTPTTPTPTPTTTTTTTTTMMTAATSSTVTSTAVTPSTSRRDRQTAQHQRVQALPASSVFHGNPPARDFREPARQPVPDALGGAPPRPGPRGAAGAGPGFHARLTSAPAAQRGRGRRAHACVARGVQVAFHLHVVIPGDATPKSRRRSVKCAALCRAVERGCCYCCRCIWFVGTTCFSCFIIARRKLKIDAAAAPLQERIWLCTMMALARHNNSHVVCVPPVFGRASSLPPLPPSSLHVARQPRPKNSCCTAPHHHQKPLPLPVACACRCLHRPRLFCSDHELNAPPCTPSGKTFISPWPCSPFVFHFFGFTFLFLLFFSALTLHARGVLPARSTGALTPTIESADSCSMRACSPPTAPTG